MPDQYEDLRKLQGIGTYTAGAIASIAFGKPYPAVDGNALRILSRLRMDHRPINDPKVKTAVEKEMKDSMPIQRPGEFNQALMDIGAGICLPHGTPLCGNCPLQDNCMAYRSQQQLLFPVKSAKKPRKIEGRTILIVTIAGRYAIHKRPRGLLAGMYEFPNMDGFCTEAQVYDFLQQQGILPLEIRQGDQATHIFTHKEWHMISYLITADLFPEALSRKADKQIDVLADNSVQNWTFASPQDIRNDYPIPSAFRSFTKYVQ
jgi:adenine-specific DNA glycosylase